MTKRKPSITMIKKIISYTLPFRWKNRIRNALVSSPIKIEDKQISEVKKLFADKNFKAIINHFQDILISNETAIIGVFLARSYSKLGDFERASIKYKEVLETKSKPATKAVEYEYGLSLLRAGHYSHSIEVLEKLLHNTAGHRFNYSPLIIAHSKSGHDEKAMKLLGEVRTYDPLNPRYIALNIDLQKKNGNRHFWKEVERQIIDYDWEGSASVTIAAPLLSWLLKISKFNLVKKIAARLPQNVWKSDELQEVIALLSYYDGEYKNALKICNSLIEKKGELTRLIVLKANSHSGAKEFREARSCFEKLLQREPNNTLYKRLIGVLDTITNELCSEQSKRASEARSINNVSDDQLTAVQKRIVHDLRSKGIAKVHVNELFSNKELGLWERAQSFMTNFNERSDVRELYEKIISSEDFENEAYFTGPNAPKHVSRSKPSVISYSSFEKHFDVENPFSLFFSSEKILQIAASYYQIAPKVRNVTLWINPPISKTNQINAKGSQLWHRDQEDKSILKCFAYFSDINEFSGALQYVPTSATNANGKYSAIYPFPATSGYPGGNFISEKVKADDITIASGQIGTLYFVDTNGFHKGGLVKEHTRYIGAATYLRPFAAATFNGQTSVIQGEIQNDKSALQRHAIT